ncbi:MAG: hypothetical protein KUG82_18485 [Pseudomonadales bacterium]|nr:hypothetical protein [Pseudomonadales bacterium]
MELSKKSATAGYQLNRNKHLPYFLLTNYKESDFFGIAVRANADVTKR